MPYGSVGCWNRPDIICRLGPKFIVKVVAEGSAELSYQAPADWVGRAPLSKPRSSLF